MQNWWKHEWALHLYFEDHLLIQMHINNTSSSVTGQ